MAARNYQLLLEGFNFVGDGIEKTSNWRKGKQIGGGTFSDVCSAKVPVQRIEVDLVVKHVRTPHTKKGLQHKKTALDEIEALKKLNKLSHERIVKLFGYCIEDFAIYIFIERMNQSLEGFIDENKGPLSQHLICRFTKQLLEGIQYLKENRILHRDIKSANILMSDKENIKLADFGVSKMFMTLSQAKTASTGTVKYMAPEMFTGEHYSYPIDVWAVGCVVIEMSTGGELFPDKEEQQIYTIMMGSTSSPLKYMKHVLPEPIMQFLQPIFQKDSFRRPNANDLLYHPFVQGKPNASNSLYTLSSKNERKTDYTEILSQTVLNKSIISSESSDEEDYGMFLNADDSFETIEYLRHDLSDTVLNRSTDSMKYIFKLS